MERIQSEIRVVFKWLHKMILFIDHNDSFVHNLIAWFKENSRAKVQIVNCSDLNKVSLKKVKLVVFSPGPGHPKDYQSSISFYQKLPPALPFFGVCLGFQMMLLANGAKIVPVAKQPIHGKQIILQKNIESRLLPPNALKGYFVLYNSLGIEKNDLIFRNEFTLLSTHSKFALAAEHAQRPHLGVQFHPESFASPGGDFFMRHILKLLKC